MADSRLEELTKVMKSSFGTQPEEPVDLSDPKKIHHRMQRILREHDLKESDIPLNHEYWYLLNKYRGMKNG